MLWLLCPSLPKDCQSSVVINSGPCLCRHKGTFLSLSGHVFFFLSWLVQTSLARNCHVGSACWCVWECDGRSMDGRLGFGLLCFSGSRSHFYFPEEQSCKGWFMISEWLNGLANFWPFWHYWHYYAWLNNTRCSSPCVNFCFAKLLSVFLYCFFMKDKSISAILCAFNLLSFGMTKCFYFILYFIL